jgi:hypothetical protein
MSLRALTLIVLVLGISACGTRLNPFNWFGGEREQRIAVQDQVEMTDSRGLVREVLRLSVEATSIGAIVTATGLPPTQGFWAADLVEVAREAGTVTYEFRVFPPPGVADVNTQASREVVVATTLSMRDLSEVRIIQVLGQENSRSVSRR